MAQGKVTEFFNARKRNASIQPSKRRKVQILDQDHTSNSDNPVKAETTTRITRTTRQKAVKVDTPVAIKSVQNVNKRAARTSARKSKTKSPQPLEEYPTIKSFFNVDTKGALEEATAAQDDHCASPATPTKVSRKRGNKNEIPADHIREMICTPESTKAYNFGSFVNSKKSPEVTARRKLHMPKGHSPKANSKQVKV